MRRTLIALIVLCTAGPLAWTLGAQQETPAPLPGYSAEDSRVERQWERKFRDIPSPDRLRESMQLLSAHPHHVGSPYDQRNAEWIAARLKEWGWDVHIETFQILFPTPRERHVELLEPTRFVAKLREPPVAGDPTTSQQSEQLPAYNAFSTDGDVTGPLVYVNFGVPDDYDQLERMGVSVKGAIVIARYGGSWRGIKPKVAAEHGAIGCLIYSDPREDGYSEGDVFPKGAWRPVDGVQRGSVMDLPLYPGDALTPGVAATTGAKRLELKDVTVFTKIPVLPISYGDAQPLLAALGGQTAPRAWRGALGITYHIGAGPAKVHLKVKSEWDTKTIYDVIARMEGASEPGQWVIRGNHHDAWVNGAQDPLSGLTAELEEARALGELAKQGWRPKRTIIYCAWDAEEPGLVGSTEWVEAHVDELREHGVAYINSDSMSRGYLNVAGSHTLQTFMNQVAQDVTDPEKGISVWQRSQAHLLAAASPGEREGLRTRTSWPIDALGTGSDYTAFLDFAGVASINLGYSGEGEGGIYHSIYDDFYWYTHFGDTNFVYGRAMAQMAGSTVMRLVGADLLPFNFADLAGTVHGYVMDIERLAETQRNRIEERNREIGEGTLAAVADPAGVSVPPVPETVPPKLDFSALDTAAETLSRSGDHYQKAFAAAQANGGAALGGAAAPAIQKINEQLTHAERALTDPKGLPGRPWYKHQLYAPGFYTGYGVKTMPAVREAVEQKQWELARQSIENVSKVLENAAGAIERAATDLDRAAH